MVIFNLLLNITILSWGVDGEYRKEQGHWAVPS